jgi:hypothetical protein
MDGHHRIEEKSQIDTPGFHGKLEGFGVAIKGPWAFLGGNGDAAFIGPSQQTIFERAIRRLVNDLNSTIGNGNHSYHRGDRCRFKAGKGGAGLNVFYAHKCPLLKIGVFDE